MKSSGRKVLAVMVAASCVASLTTFRSNEPAAAEPAAQTQLWTARASTHLLPDSLPSDSGAGRAIQLDAARNEFEAGQVAIRRGKAFTIKRVSFTPLRAGQHQIAASDLSANFVKFTALNHNSVFGGNQYVYAPSRPAPDDFPDGLSNAPTTTVEANKTQPIWIRVHVPKTAAGGIYRGAVRVETDHGTFSVPLNYEWKPQAFDEARAQGKDLWLYNCNIPTQGFLNRFVDQPEYYQRLIGWLAAARNANGHLHWAFNNWNISMDDQDVKGDFWVVNPDRERNLLERTLRLESLRDGIEDWEVVTILKKTHPDLATDLAKALASTPGTFTGDVTFLDRIRSLVLDAAAGKPLAARELAQTIKTGAAADLGSQYQVDGVFLRWGAGQPAEYTIQTSYDGVTWVDAARRTAADGGEDFVGINGKARHVRLKSAAPELISFKVAGSRLARENLVGGREYKKSWEPPNGFPDSSLRESTDGVISDNFGDGRPYVIQGKPDEKKDFDISFDLGSVKTVREVDVQGYVEYSGYRPDTVRVLTSTDGVTWTDRGGVTRPNDASGNRYEVSFHPVEAKHVKVAFTRTFTKSADGVFLDEIEIY